MGRVFLITGTSTGLGKELVKVVLSKGDSVIATARNSSRLEFSETNENNYLAVDLDVTSISSIDEAFGAGLRKFRQIDVVVNNAGYGLCGEFEGLSDEQVRQQMEVNFFGVVNVTRKALEVMRSQKTGGVIQQITSIGGQKGIPLTSMYCASKWAVEGFTEAVAHEVKPEWNIHLTCVEPGGFRTEWAGRSMDFGTPHPAYDHLNARERMKKRNGTQEGDPIKGAQAFYELATMKDPPLRCIVGSDAYRMLNEKLMDYQKNVKRFEKLSLSTDMDEG